MNRRVVQIVPARRRGSMLPAIALAILISGGCLALVLNFYWLAGAQEELRSVAQAAALAGAQRLACDDLLKPDADLLPVADAAREAAQEMAAQSPVAGPVAPRLDIRLGRVVPDSLTGAQQLIDTDDAPTSVLVAARRDQYKNNPLLVLAPALMGRSWADVAATAEASLSNVIEGIRPFGVAAAPAWPMAVLQTSSNPRVQTWQKQIEQRQGPDHYSWDQTNRQVAEDSDGLPEIVLTPQGGLSNLVLLDLGSQFAPEVLSDQFASGWRAEDLAAFGGEFSLQAGPQTLPASQDFSGSPGELLAQQVGQARIFLLYDSLQSNGQQGQTARVTRLVAGRIMSVSDDDNNLQIVLQPAVVATRMAQLDQTALQDPAAQGNPYIYKIAITK